MYFLFSVFCLGLCYRADDKLLLNATETACCSCPPFLSQGDWVSSTSLSFQPPKFLDESISPWGTKKLLNCHRRKKYQLIFSRVEVRCPWSYCHWFTECTRLLWEHLSWLWPFIVEARNANIPFKSHGVASWCIQMNDQLSCRPFMCLRAGAVHQREHKQTHRLVWTMLINICWLC